MWCDHMNEHLVNVLSRWAHSLIRRLLARITSTEAGMTCLDGKGAEGLAWSDGGLGVCGQLLHVWMRKAARSTPVWHSPRPSRDVTEVVGRRAIK